jgi:pimeloyl-ACP methyl ester carboxylesterase
MTLRKLWGLPSLVALLASCWWIPRPAVVPLRTIAYPGSGPAGGDLIVFLPGRGDRAEDFERRGFLAAARRAGIRADVLAVDAHLAYYRKRVIADRIWSDVVSPARARGYRQLWFVGISLGGLGSLALAQHHPGAAAGILAIAPYLGEPELPREIEAAGGLARWNGQSSEADFRGLWAWLRGYAGGEERPPLWLAHGEADRYAYGHRLLAASLPEGRVLVGPGGHDWTAWNRLWADFLGRGGFPGTVQARIISSEDASR